MNKNSWAIDSDFIENQGDNVIKHYTQKTDKILVDVLLLRWGLSYRVKSSVVDDNPDNSILLNYWDVIYEFKENAVDNYNRLIDYYQIAYLSE